MIVWRWADRHFYRFTAAAGIADFVAGVVSVHKVLHDAAAFEDADLLSVGMGIGDCWDAAVGVDGCEPVGLLLVGGHVDLADIVGQAELSECDANLDAVGRLAGV